MLITTILFIVTVSSASVKGHTIMVAKNGTSTALMTRTASIPLYGTPGKDQRVQEHAYPQWRNAMLFAQHGCTSGEHRKPETPRPTKHWCILLSRAEVFMIVQWSANTEQHFSLGTQDADFNHYYVSSLVWALYRYLFQNWHKSL